MGSFKSNDTSPLRVILISIAPPRGDCGVRVVLHRHLVEEKPFVLHVASNADFADDLLIHTLLQLPYILNRIRKCRFGPSLSKWLIDYENLVWALKIPRVLDEAVRDFRPDIILTLADTSLSNLASMLAVKHNIPLVGLFLDWFPIMKHHYGHEWTRKLLSRRFRRLYQQCDLAFCTSEGMKNVLGDHDNSHVIYPISGRHRIPDAVYPPKTGKFRLVYVGSVENFYGRMICSLIGAIERTMDLEFIVVGPNADWPAEILERTKERGSYLGFRTPEAAAEVLAGADALLVVMSFEAEHRLFMETSFTTKFLDYSAYAKPIIIWGPEYCTPVRLVRREGGAVVVATPDPEGVISVCQLLATDPHISKEYTTQAEQLHTGLFSPERLQGIFVNKIKSLIAQKQSMDGSKATK